MTKWVNDVLAAKIELKDGNSTDTSNQNKKEELWCRDQELASIVFKTK